MNATLPKIVGARISKKRRGLGLTQEELAFKVGVSRVYIGYIEQARHVPSWEVLQKLSKILKTPMSDFIK